jgi:hypothetical protein
MLDDVRQDIAANQNPAAGRNRLSRTREGFVPNGGNTGVDTRNNRTSASGRQGEGCLSERCCALLFSTRGLRKTLLRTRVDRRHAGRTRTTRNCHRQLPPKSRRARRDDCRDIDTLCRAMSILKRLGEINRVRLAAGSFQVRSSPVLRQALTRNSRPPMPRYWGARNTT